MIDIMVIRYLQSICHQISTCECLALKWQWSIVNTVELVNAVGLVCIKSCHLNPWQMLVDECFGLPPIEHGLVLGIVNIHQRCHTLLVVWRLQTLDITQLHYRAYSLVFGYGVLAQCLFLVGHVLGLYLHS